MAEEEKRKHIRWRNHEERDEDLSRGDHQDYGEGEDEQFVHG